MTRGYRRTTSMVLSIGLILTAATSVSAQFPRSGSSLTEAKIGDGLKQALQVGTENAIGLTGKLDGYFANSAIVVGKALDGLFVVVAQEEQRIRSNPTAV